MIIPICQHCQHKWSWLQTFNKLFAIRKRLKCMYCGKEQYQSAASRKATSILALVPSFIIALIFLFEPSQTMIYLCAAIIMIICCLLLPLLIRLSNEDEPMW